MRYGLDEIDYKKTYFKYTWLTYLFLGLFFLLGILLNNLPSQYDELSDTIRPIAMAGVFALIICVVTGLPFVIYTSVKKWLRDGYIIMDSNYIKLVRTCNIVDSPDSDSRKYKVTKYFNVTKIKETMFCYKITGEIDYYYNKRVDADEKTIIKHKKGTFRLPKCFGEKSSFEKQLYSLVSSTRIKSAETTLGKRPFITSTGILDFIISVIGVLLVFFSGSSFIMLVGLTLTGWKGIKGINVIREEHRDVFLSIVNIIIGIATFVLLVMLASTGN